MENWGIGNRELGNGKLGIQNGKSFIQNKIWLRNVGNCLFPDIEPSAVEENLAKKLLAYNL